MSESTSWLSLIKHYDQVASTMDVAKTLAEEGAPHGTTVVATSQNSGRGRLGRTWFSPAGAGLWATTLLRPQNSLSELSQLGLVTGVATLSCLHSLGANQAQLKWPNDIMVKNRKLAGILLEAHQLDSSSPLVLLGVGINLAKADTLELPPEITDRYLGLAEIVQAEENLHQEALHTLIRCLETRYNQWVNLGLEPLLPFWEENDWLRGHVIRATAEEGEIEGVVQGINELGELQVQTPEGTSSIRSGEVQRIRPIPTP